MSVAGIPCCLVYIDALTDKQLLDISFIRPLLAVESFEPPFKDEIFKKTSYQDNIKEVEIAESPHYVGEGDIIFFVDNAKKALIISFRQWNIRAISEPPTESVLKGPREGFVEDFRTNITLLRRRIKSPNFVCKTLQIGRYTATQVALLYIKGVTNANVLKEVVRKLEDIDIDGIVDTSMLANYLAPKHNSLFRRTGLSEKPDVVSSKILEGRIAIIVDGSPMVMTVPFLLLEDLQDAHDYYATSWRATMNRIIRIIGVTLTILLPGAYVALQTYHYHLLPVKFLITLLSTTTNIPFPPAVEMLFVLILFEILNQASIRMPRFMGTSLSIVGAIVLGDTAVKAGLISSPSVLIIALSSIGIFCLPEQVGVISILRLLVLLASSVLGLLGMIVLILISVAYLTTLDTFGSPYLAPFAPHITKDMKDAVFKASTSSMTERPYSLLSKNKTRQSK